MSDRPIDLGDGLTLPLDAVTQTFAILAKRGMGKTYTASVLVEEMLEQQQRVVVIDPIGVWWGLRSSATGKSAGYPVLIIGGDHGDLPLEKGSGELVADLIIDQDLAIVIDLSLLRKGDQRTFMTTFAERLYHRNRKPLHLVVDEADAYAPQRPPKGDGPRLLGAMEDLVRRGRARGIGVTLITQRSAVLNKDVLTQTEVLVAMRVTGPQDREALDAWIRQHGTDEERAELLESLASLPVGTAWVWSPGWLGLFRRVKIRKRRTFDSSATPEVGGTVAVPRGYAEVDLDAVRERMSAVVERAEQDDPKRLRTEIRRLERELAEAAASTPEPVVERVEVPVLDAELVTRLEDGLRDGLDRVEHLAKGIDGLLTAVRDAVELASERTRRTVPAQRRSTPQPRRPDPGLPVSRTSSRSPKPEVDGDVKLRAGARRMLETLASFYPEGMTRPQVGGLSCLSHRGGTFTTYLGELRRGGLIDEHSDLLYATEAGVDAAGVDVPPPPTTVGEVVELWSGRLRAGARRMLEAVVDAMPGELDREDLAAAAGIEASGGTFSTYLGELRRYGLVETSGSTVAAGPSFEGLR